MKARVVAPDKLLLDEPGAMYLGSKGYGVVRLEREWKRYPWATYQLTVESSTPAKDLAGMVRDYADFVSAT